MKAFETRKASVQPQYDSAMKDIRQANGMGMEKCPCRSWNSVP